MQLFMPLHLLWTKEGAATLESCWISKRMGLAWPFGFWACTEGCDKQRQEVNVGAHGAAAMRCKYNRESWTKHTTTPLQAFPDALL